MGAAYIVQIVFLWVLCGICCQHLNLKNGHRYIKSFKARTPFQISLTIFNSTKDIKQKDLKKITYIGYFIDSAVKPLALAMGI